MTNDDESEDGFWASEAPTPVDRGEELEHRIVELRNALTDTVVELELERKVGAELVEQLETERAERSAMFSELRAELLAERAKPSGAQQIEALRAAMWSAVLDDDEAAQIKRSVLLALRASYQGAR